MKPETEKQFIQWWLDSLHNMVKMIGFNAHALDTDEADKAFEDFEQRVLAAARLFRFALKIPYTHYEQWREDELQQMRHELALHLAYRNLIKYKKVYSNV
jgi:hypothetical protein